MQFAPPERQPQVKLFNTKDQILSYIDTACKEDLEKNQFCYDYDEQIKHARANEIIDPTLLTKNMFINYYNRGRYGNYVYGIYYTIRYLLSIEHALTRMPMIDITKKISEQNGFSKLYSVQNCKRVDDIESGVTDKYNFLNKKKKSSSFNHFICHHFAEDTDFLLSKCTLLFTNANFKVYFFNNNLIFYLNEDMLYTIYQALCMRDESDIIELLLSNIWGSTQCTYEGNVDFSNKAILEIMNDAKRITELKKHDTFDNTIKDTFRTKLLNELNNCFGKKQSNFIICTIKAYSHLQIPHYSWGIIKKDSINMRSCIKSLIFPELSVIKKLYTQYCDTHNKEDYILAVVHFRGGDFERFNNKKHKLIKPCVYLENLRELYSKINGKKIKLLCCFNSNDIIFYAYINIMQHVYPELEIIHETDLGDLFMPIFNEDANHIAFMSLFQYMILSNSTYSHFSADMNITNDSLIIRNDIYNIRQVTSLKTHNMSLSHSRFFIDITWNISFYAYYLAYNNIGAIIRITDNTNPNYMLITVDTQLINENFIIFDNKLDDPETVDSFKARIAQFKLITTYNDIINTEKKELRKFAESIIELNENSVIFKKNSILYKYTLIETYNGFLLQEHVISNIHFVKYHKYKTKYNQIKNFY